jgi:dTDP-4-dehydrorhamnose 3,5-epimerase-like enzyme
MVVTESVLTSPADQINMYESVNSFREDNGDLVVIEGGVHVPFVIARLFVVRAHDGAIRGQHAHRECSQFLTCTSGTIEVLCDDGEQTAEFVLNEPNSGLLVPPKIWSQQT